MREQMVSDWLAMTPWRGWRRDPMTGDASARSYERLTAPNGDQVILMLAPIETCGSQGPFVDMAGHLKSLGLCPPNILDWDEALGLMVLSDLGKTDVAQHLRQAPHDEVEIYRTAAHALRRIGESPPPPGLIKMTPDVGAQMLEPAFQYAATSESVDLQDQIEGQLKGLLQQIDPAPRTLSLRDFHAENLIWRPDLSGTDRIGLLDFQDAFVTHPAYDIASLLRDARRDVINDMVDDLLAIVLPDQNRIERREAFHVMALQRNLRILGIFQKLAREDGKTGYLQFVPRVWAHLLEDLKAPCLADIRPLVLEAFAT